VRTSGRVATPARRYEMLPTDSRKRPCSTESLGPLEPRCAPWSPHLSAHVLLAFGDASPNEGDPGTSGQQDLTTTQRDMHLGKAAIEGAIRRIDGSRRSTSHMGGGRRPEY
jgi:hypothetical protein